SLKSICSQAATVGGRAVRDLLLMDGAALAQGVAMISQGAADLLDRALAGAGRLIVRLAKAAIRLLLQAYDGGLALLGKDVEQAARRQVGEWLDDLRKEPKASEESETLLGKLIHRVYAPAAIQDEVTQWLQTTAAPAARMNEAAEAVRG